LSAVRNCCSIYSQLLSISGGSLLHPPSEDAPCRGDGLTATVPTFLPVTYKIPAVVAAVTHLCPVAYISFETFSCVLPNRALLVILHLTMSLARHVFIITTYLKGSNVSCHTLSTIFSPVLSTPSHISITASPVRFTG
jgi:hypothetical protein